ncbi:MAG: hypothetical protein P0107_08640, partial [Nitrosomonas sp.]|nr:hypothetical protein [Nitrosomonas sp.]
MRGNETHSAPSGLVIAAIPARRSAIVPAMAGQPGRREGEGSCSDAPVNALVSVRESVAENIGGGDCRLCWLVIFAGSLIWSAALS